jgi:hypothetical protein
MHKHSLLIILSIILVNYNTGYSFKPSNCDANQLFIQATSSDSIDMSIISESNKSDRARILITIAGICLFVGSVLLVMVAVNGSGMQMNIFN